MKPSGIPIEELSVETIEKLGLKEDKLPEKWNVYARALLLISQLPFADAFWVINRIRRELDSMNKARHENDKRS